MDQEVFHFEGLDSAQSFNGSDLNGAELGALV